MKEIRLANKIIKTLLKDRLHYPDRLVVDTVGILARCGVSLMLYSYVFKLNNGVIQGTTFQLIAWSMFFYFIFSTWRLRDISHAIMLDVQSGNVEVLFSKPVSYLAYRMYWQVGMGLYQYVVIGTLGAITLISTLGLPPMMTSLMYIPTFLITLILGVILSLTLYSIVGLLAFWMEDISPVFWLVDKSVMILGGSYLPIALFPKTMYNIALYSPFGASQFTSHTVYQSWSKSWYFHNIIQVFWICLLSAVLYFIFDKARKRVSVNGG